MVAVCFWIWTVILYKRERAFDHFNFEGSYFLKYVIMIITHLIGMHLLHKCLKYVEIIFLQ